MFPQLAKAGPDGERYVQDIRAVRVAVRPRGPPLAPDPLGQRDRDAGHLPVGPHDLDGRALVRYVPHFVPVHREPDGDGALERHRHALVQRVIRHAGDAHDVGAEAHRLALHPVRGGIGISQVDAAAGHGTVLLPELPGVGDDVADNSPDVVIVHEVVEGIPIHPLAGAVVEHALRPSPSSLAEAVDLVARSGWVAIPERVDGRRRVAWPHRRDIHSSTQNVRPRAARRRRARRTIPPRTTYATTMRAMRSATRASRRHRAQGDDDEEPRSSSVCMSPRRHVGSNITVRVCRHAGWHTNCFTVSVQQAAPDGTRGTPGSTQFRPRPR